MSASVQWTGKNCSEVSDLLGLDTECPEGCKNHKLYLLWINNLPYWAVIGDTITVDENQITLTSPKRNLHISGCSTSPVSGNFLSV